ncbi:MAG: SGNH/GDSL hydrolase family protein, partial [Phycisphaerales bacterium]|nr:SGNH/GDSL hydrolase family protein [Phycisphaerales bacterium]
VPFVKRLRSKRPDTPILLVEDRTYADSHVNSDRMQNNVGNRVALRKALDELKADKVANIHYLEGDRLLSSDGDGTVDGSHPTDLGFRQQADAFKEVIVPVLMPGKQSP